MPRIERIAIIGTGLIGASFALAIRKAGYSGEIVGCDKPEVLAQARALRVVDRGVMNPVEAVNGVQLVVLATPVVASLELLATIAPHTADALITDVGSTKLQIAEQADRLFGGDSLRRFLPGHPMAGREFSGVAAAEDSLFNDATWILTPRRGRHAMLAPELTRSLHAEFIRLLESIGARVVILAPERHDRMLAFLSHLPQVVSTALAATVKDELGDDPSIPMLTGGGLKGMIRLAASDPAMWESIANTNSENIAEALLAIEREIARLRESLGTKDFRREFERARSFNPTATPAADTAPPKF
jgi:prephenate dehydrogenase